ncbi:MAG: type II secretion system F family protein [Anaerolineae bacterium]|nr:type II secretion system F family protein [Anaerolineae bacterium]
MTVQDIEALLDYLIGAESLASPALFGLLAGLAVLLVWVAVRPTRAETDEAGRLEGYLRNRDIIEETELEKSFIRRAMIPAIGRVLRALGALTPWRDLERIQRRLAEAGHPLGLSAPDVLGLQILVALAFGGAYVLVMQLLGQLGPERVTVHVRNGLLITAFGYLLPRLWLRSRADRRKHEIERAFPDALDLLSVSVDAGLALDSAIVKVCERWANALTAEFNRVILETRVGTPRTEALERMAKRTGVRDVATFVGVLVQSTELGVSIAETLHSQAAQVRLRRRQRAEELARQASVKMVFALVFLIFPALLVVLLGPGVPRIFEALGGL